MPHQFTETANEFITQWYVAHVQNGKLEAWFERGRFRHLMSEFGDLMHTCVVVLNRSQGDQFGLSLNLKSFTNLVKCCIICRAKNLLGSKYRRSGKPLEFAVLAAANSGTPIDDARLNELSQHLVDCIDTLPDKSRNAFSVWIKAYSYQAIENQLDISPSAARQRVSRGRKLLIECMRPKGYSRRELMGI